jgi:hypothetical protein
MSQGYSGEEQLFRGGVFDHDPMTIIGSPHEVSVKATHTSVQLTMTHNNICDQGLTAHHKQKECSVPILQQRFSMETTELGNLPLCETPW